ncbi:MAG: hypothetical protein HW421_573 [Ignavibacteria bacterium]|nr:hypothetical protein [Ignavibacteria bacterium]
MKRNELNDSPIEGKTYSLFGNSSSTNEYYIKIKELTDTIIEEEPNINSALKTLQQYSNKKRFLRKIIINPIKDKLISDWLNLINTELMPYTQKVKEHLRNLSFTKFRDKRLRITREQYHLYMLEIELTNRLFVNDFRNSAFKIALLPYCLQDFSMECKSEKNDFDYQCKHCSLSCYQNHASIILKKNQIEPYIWMDSDIKKLAMNTMKKGQSFGILGIACIPLLVWGMRKYRKKNIPVVGIPLNANRCKRWFGEFLPNSINLDELEKLVSY